MLALHLDLYFVEKRGSAVNKYQGRNSVIDRGMYLRTYRPPVGRVGDLKTIVGQEHSLRNMMVKSTQISFKDSAEKILES